MSYLTKKEIMDLLDEQVDKLKRGLEWNSSSPREIYGNKILSNEDYSELTEKYGVLGDNDELYDLLIKQRLGDLGIYSSSVLHDSETHIRHLIIGLEGCRDEIDELEEIIENQESYINWLEGQSQVKGEEFE